MTIRRYICFDLGGTDIKWGLVREDGAVLHKASFPTREGSREELLGDIIAAIEPYQGTIEGAAFSAPGFIHPDGYIEMGGALEQLHEFHFRKYMEEKLGLPVTVENDVNCVALAEQWLGSASDIEDFYCMTVGTGIGGAVVINGRIHRGHGFRAGEAGYMVTHGLHGDVPEADSLSAQASMYGLRRRFAAYKEKEVQDVTGEDVFEAYDAGDPLAVRSVTHFYEALAIGIYNTVSVLNPEKVLIGGGITSRPTFLDELQFHLDYVDRVFHCPVTLCRFKNDAGLIGALAYHLSNQPEQASPVDPATQVGGES
ncbi:ROK family protein [Alkalicoccus chagannorensis]|uniref:ROK family protein n=1 Tax=Alkalicoccus chagannorensis TaxID=427072 RepID=UPI0003FE46A9|nr:ROK family protein [Alkalicoccus chagannorensis]